MLTERVCTWTSQASFFHTFPLFSLPRFTHFLPKKHTNISTDLSYRKCYVSISIEHQGVKMFHFFGCCCCNCYRCCYCYCPLCSCSPTSLFFSHSIHVAYSIYAIIVFTTILLRINFIKRIAIKEISENEEATEPAVAVAVAVECVWLHFQ